MMTRTLPALLALPLLIATGYLHGSWTDRWAPSRSVGEAAARLARVPEVIGGWRGESAQMDAKVVAMAGIDGYVMRRYVDPEAGTAVSVLLVCGRPGPIAAHTPEVCYGGAGYEALTETAHQAVRVGGAAPPADFFTAVFGKTRAAAPESLRIFWSWNGGEGWETSDHPRLRFARHGALYKLYVVRELGARGRLPADADPALDFVKQLLPQLDKALF